MEEARPAQTPERAAARPDDATAARTRPIDAGAAQDAEPDATDVAAARHGAEDAAAATLAMTARGFGSHKGTEAD